MSDPAHSNHFQCFDLPVSFELDQAVLDQRYRDAVRQVHPDRFVAAGEQEQRAAVERAATLNEAYQVLRSATQRALYLLNLQTPMDEEATVQDPEFLFQQMEWSEELEELGESGDFAAIDRFRKRLLQARSQVEQDFAACWQQDGQRQQAERQVRRMQFLDKQLREVRQLEERLDD